MTARFWRVTALFGLLCGASIAEAADSALPLERQRAILREALSAYDQAGETARSDPERASELYRQAAADFQALRDAGVRNACLEYNLGNTYFRLGELGRAILHYRRAERIGPPDARLEANLRYARGQVEPLILPSGQHRLVRQLLFLHYSTTIGQRFAALAILGGAGWVALLGWLRWRYRPIVITGVCLVGVAVLAGSSILWQTRQELRNPSAVLVVGPQPLRLGRSESADLALRQPLGPGTEFLILQQRGDWVEVRLPNDLSGWLPAATMEPV